MISFIPVHTLPIFFCGLLLPVDQAQAIVELNNSIGRSNTLCFTLSQKDHPPYLRLYETVLPDKNIALAEAAVANLGKNMIPFKIKWGLLEATHKNVILWGENNVVLTPFHQAVLENLSSLREGHYKEKYAEVMNTLPEAEQKSVLKWGSPWAEPYIPHVVVAKAPTRLEFRDIFMEWDYRWCEFNGMIAGIRYEDGELVEYKHWPFGEYKIS